MKVLFITRKFYPDVIGGGQISALYIAKAVKEQGHDITILTYHDKPHQEDSLHGIRVIREPIPPLKLLPRLSNMEYMYWQMARIADKHISSVNPDIVHCLNTESIPAFALFSKYRKKIPFVATNNGVMLTDFIGCTLDSKGKTRFTFPTMELHRMIRARWGKQNSYLRFISPLILVYAKFHMSLLKKAGRRAARLLPVSDAIKEVFLANGYPEEQLTVIYNPIDPVEKTVLGMKEKLGIAGHILLYMGRLDKMKGISLLIQAMQDIDATLLIVGKGDDEKEFKNLTRHLGLERKVLFIGYIDYDKIGEYYSMTDIAVLPGTYYEPLSRMLLEACSYGVPCVVSDRGGNKEVILDGENGIIMKELTKNCLVEEINSLLQDEKKRSLFGKRSKEIVRELFSSESVGKSLIKIYQEVLENGNDET